MTTTRIMRVFNNNVVLARDPDRGEVILTGRGLGFSARPGDDVDPDRVERTFVPEDGRDPDTLAAVVASVPSKYLDLASRAVARTRRSVPAGTVIAIADHIAVAVLRQSRGNAGEHPLGLEVNTLYPDEAALAASIIETVNTEGDLSLPPGDATAIALHLVQAGLSTGDLTLTYRMTGLFAQVLDVLEQLVEREIPRESINAARFVTHLRYLVARTAAGRQLQDGTDATALAIRQAHPEAFHAAQRLRGLLELRLEATLTEDEVTYLAMHVARLVSDTRER